MEHLRSTPVPERPLSQEELALVRWLLTNAPVAGSLADLAPLVASLRVVGRCSCGCPSVDFRSNGQSSPFRPIADATGRTADGAQVGVILWGHEDVISGLEIYQMVGLVRELPAVESLKPW
jgi:hypothetical protein